MRAASLLSTIPFFSSLEADDLRALATSCRSRTFERGEVLFHEGDPSTGLYILRSGRVKIVLVDASGEETVLHVEGPGDCLGELSLVDGEPRSATAVALERVDALALHRQDFLDLLDRRRSVERAVMKGLAAMVRRLSTHVHDLSSLDVEERLAKKLLELAARHGEATPDGTRIAARLSQQDLARMVGLTRASVNKHLRIFEAEGLLIADRDGILIRNPEALRKWVGEA
jgi:CRP/FNR family cyclic AMP-dependent transcriptional regulator